MISLESISKGKARKAPRCVLIGVEGVGKSTFAAGAPNPIFIPIRGETGLDEIDSHKMPPILAYDRLEKHKVEGPTLMDAISFLFSADHNYQTAVIDSGSALEPLIWDHTAKAENVDSIEKVGGGFHKGYVECLRYWREVTDAMDALREERGMGCILIGHVKVKPFNDPMTEPYDTYILDLHERTTNLLYRWADCILFANFKTFTKKADVGEIKKTKGTFEANRKVTHGIGGEARVLYTEKRPAHPGKNRYGLPYELPLDYAAFAEALARSAEQPANTSNQ